MHSPHDPNLDDPKLGDANLDENVLQSLRNALVPPEADAAEASRRTRELADRLAASLSQLPAHVEFAGRPATELECAAMLESLPLFEQLAEAAGLRQRYTGLVARCRLHYTAYREYRSRDDRPETYVEFFAEP
ncbi:hypothetical protein [Candidatus Laterigemmans baculatus]|uniref:hypothetical protein n=1 Tax=Candidatus Laterigemmans baculatus TaxID=2770505 RepID=UPI0013DB717E|nr:hypothetical protein [Candidatus Laterigemmans baculatus]